MEFQAYPTAVPSGRKDVRTMWKLQNMLHSSDSIVLPATMLLLGSLLVAYQHCTHWDTSRSSIRNFLIKVLVSMVPLGILEFKVPRCADPVGLFAKFSTKVMMMHIAFLLMRMGLTLRGAEAGNRRFDAAMLLAACLLLPIVFGFRPTRRAACEHFDVLLLVVVPTALAALEIRTFEWFKWSSPWLRDRLVEDIVFTSSDYIEIIAFVPAVWMAYRRGGEAAEQDVAQVSASQKRALCLFAFMAVFYSVEDVGNAIAVLGDFRIAALGHMAHYLLVLDFAGFLLAQLCDPAKLQAMKGSFVGWLADSCAV